MLAGNAREDYFNEIEEKESNAQALKSSVWTSSLFGENNKFCLFTMGFLVVIRQGFFREYGILLWNFTVGLILVESFKPSID